MSFNVSKMIADLDPWTKIVVAGVLLAGLVSGMMLYLPHGRWKIILIVMAVAGILIAVRNPKYRLMQMGILCITTALAGLAMSIVASLSLHQPDGAETRLEVAVQSAAGEWVFLLVLLMGGALMVIDRIWPHRGDADMPPAEVRGLICVQPQTEFAVVPHRADADLMEFSFELSCTNQSDEALSIVRIDCTVIKTATALFDEQDDGIFLHGEIGPRERRRLNIHGQLRAAAFKDAQLKLTCRIVLVDNLNRPVQPEPLIVVLTRTS